MNTPYYNDNEDYFDDDDLEWAPANNKSARENVERTIRSLDLISATEAPKRASVNRDAFPFVPDPPCVGCKSYNDCSALELACRQFSAYVSEGNDSISKRSITQMEPDRWIKYSRIPNSLIYARIFKKGDPDSQTDEP